MRLTALLLLAVPASMYAFSSGPPQRRTGAQVDDTGTTCTACHRGTELNSDTRGRLTIEANDYKPGVKQTIRIILEHPEASRWGFQLTARLASNEASKAGTFTQVADRIRVRCNQAATDGNCGSETEFASHVQASTNAGQRNRAVWEIEWTPPAAGSGEVVFYAAGNAANNSNSNAGDIIYNTSKRIKAESCNLTDRPVISSVRNAASFIDGALAMNTIFTIGGRNLQAAGVQRTVEAVDIRDGRFPNELACMAVTVNNVRAPILYTQANQINAQVPTLSALGTVAVVAIANPGGSNELRSDPVNITLAGTSPAFFRLLPTPCIAAVFALTGELTGDPSLFPQGFPVRGAKIGDILSLYATGLGVSEPIYQAGEVISGAVSLKDRITVEWQSRPGQVTVIEGADILYAGLAPGSISGLYQINIRVPSTANAGVQNQVRVRAGGVLSPEGTTIYVSAQ